MWRRFTRTGQVNEPTWWACVVAVVVPLISVLLLRIIGTGVYFPSGLLLLLPVMLSAYLGGLWPGVLAVGTAAVTANAYLLPASSASITIVPGVQLSQWSVGFLLVGVLSSALVEALRRARRRAETAQRLYVATLANIRDAVVTTDLGGRIEYLNRTACELVRCHDHGVLGESFASVFIVRDEQSGTGAGVMARQVLLRADGTTVPVAATATPLQGQAGTISGVVWTIRDCSEQRQIESSLHDRLAMQARFEHIAAVVPGAIHEFRLHADGRQQLLYASPAFKEIFGVEPQRFATDAAGLRAMVHPDDADQLQLITDTAMRESKPIDIEHRILTPHRGIRWISLSAVASRDADGSALWHGVFIDVTERKQAEETLRAAQLQLQAALQSGDMGIIRIDLVKGVVELDQSARTLWNLQSVTDPVLTVRHLQSVIHPDDREMAWIDYQQMCTSMGPYSSEHRLLLASGEQRWLACRGRVYQDEMIGSLVKIGVVMDITPRRIMEERRLHSQKLEALGVLAGGIAHDFNNILLAISGNTALLLNDLPSTEPALDNVHEIEKAAARATELVRRILSFSRVGDLIQPGHAQPLRPMLDEVLGLARAILPTTITIDASIPEHLSVILADSSQIHQTLINLLTNAADAAADGVIKLAVDALDVDASQRQSLPELEPGCYARITVTDQGHGIEPELLPRIFDPFFTTKSPGRGTGLGLAIVHGIMRSLNGTVTVCSSPGKGASFALYFPAQTTAVIAIAQPAAPVSATRSARIMYVDDEESLVLLLKRTLEHLGHQVTACVSPEQALQRFMAGPDDFDLIVSDMAMPVMSGIKLAKHVLAVRATLPFIITTGYADAADVERAHAVGVRQIIIKPYTAGELTAAVAAILQEQDERLLHAR